MIEFTKMEGLGNDYIYVNCVNMTDDEISKISKLASKMSDRHFGIGSDGLILICKSDVADFKMTMFNQDGSQAEMCGNGIRCVGKYVFDKGLTNKTQITIETLAGIKKLDLNIQDNKVHTVTVNMGVPILNEERIPCIADTKVMYNNDEVSHVTLKVIDKNIDLTCVSMGNPHAIALAEDVENLDVEKYGKIIECDNHFPQRVNVEFVEIIDDSTIRMRVWERGSGETMACGTGACASAVACIINNLVDKDSEITVKLNGGILKIKWDEDVYMTGPATIVFDGKYDA